VNFGRRSSTDDSGSVAVDDTDAVVVDAGKGRPTPKRSDSRKSRRGGPPKDRKEAAAERRAKNREDRAVARKALVTGDEKNLPPRDAGPERRLARDVVDSRVTAGQWLFAIIAVSLVLSLVNDKTVKLIAEFAALIAVTVITVDAQLCGRKARDTVAAKFGKPASTGIWTYAAMRAFLPRRFRKPPPKVARGAQLQ
jgi:hypothetical protein